MTLQVGERLGPYDILRKIGAGGMGEVWLAKDTPLHRQVAASYFLIELTGDADRVCTVRTGGPRRLRSEPSKTRGTIDALGETTDWSTFHRYGYT